MKTLESLSEERNGYFTWESLAALFTERISKSVSCTTVYNSCKAASWRTLWTKKPLVNSPITNPPFSFGMEVVLS